MKTTKFGQNFFETTRGQIVNLLRQNVGTVEELSRQLELTDNAVRAHLDTLARDGLVERHGLRRGPRKPHYTYALTDEAENLFPKAYDTLLNQFLAVLKHKLSPPKFEEILREVARSIAADKMSGQANESVEKRVQNALEALADLGGAPKLEGENDNFLIESTSSCPFSEVVSEHAEICHFAEILLSEIANLEVKERCQRSGKPRCAFEIKVKNKD